MAKHPIRKFQRLTTGDDAFRAKFRSWDMTELSYVDIREYLKEKDTVLVPMASTEQHGPHLPLYTDTITAIEVAQRVSEAIGVFHTPPIWTGYSPQHMHLPGEGRGTITIKASTLNALMYDVARSLIHHGFNRIIFINGHGSNTKVVDPVLRKLRYETGALIGFAGPRVVKDTTGKDLPEGFQTAEFVLEHGFLDFITPRKELKDKINLYLDLIQNNTIR